MKIYIRCNNGDTVPIEFDGMTGAINKHFARYRTAWSVTYFNKPSNTVLLSDILNRKTTGEVEVTIGLMDGQRTLVFERVTIVCE